MQSKPLYCSKILICLLLALLLSACTSPPEESELATSKPVDPLNICYGATLGSLIMIAEQEGFFREQDLAVNLILKKIGRANVAALNDGSCDVALAAETPVIHNSYTRDDFKILGTVAQSRSLNRIITFSDSGIKTGTDLKNRRIATARNSSFHFFLDVYLNKHGLTEKDINLEGMKGAELIPALEKRTVDAIVTTDMHAFRLKERLGDAIEIISAPGLNLNYGYLLADKTVTSQEPDKLNKLLAALLQSQHFIDQHPETARNRFSRTTGVSADSTEKIWLDRSYRLSFDHIMLAILDDHARWMLDKGAIVADRVPNLFNYLHLDPLKKQAPEAVNLMR
ncbi:MAG TPA: ABC transporter substrate-binding protein [Geopsychrobacteraceae bacterium]|nr:ABC transporter substrate-binding protein [Geopsychrobacteraceae bacterium]